MSVNHRSTDEQWHNIAYQTLQAEDQTSLFPRLPAVPPVCVHDYHCIRTSAGVGTGARQTRLRLPNHNLTNKNFYVYISYVNFREREMNKDTSRKNAYNVAN